jgi:serpin B
MMSQTKRFGYVQGTGYQAVELPYDGQELSMVVLLPEAGQYQGFEENLDSKQVETISDSLESTNIELTMPKFTFESDSVSLKETLSAMGMPIAFTGDADFSGMDGTMSLSIGDVIHKAFVAVDEAGTEAAAATAVVVELTALPEPPVKVTVDRPFIFLIRDIKTKSILFVGRVFDPSAGGGS